LKIVQLADDFPVDVERIFEAGSLLKCPGGAFLVGPESRVVDQYLKLLKLAGFTIRVKGTSGRPRCVSLLVQTVQ